MNFIYNTKYIKSNMKYIKSNMLSTLLNETLSMRNWDFSFIIKLLYSRHIC